MDSAFLKVSSWKRSSFSRMDELISNSGKRKTQESLSVNGVGIRSPFLKHNERRPTMYSFEIFDDDFYNNPEVTYIGYEILKNGSSIYKGVIDLDVSYGENLLKALEDYLSPDINASVERLLKQPLAKDLPDPLQRV